MRSSADLYRLTDHIGGAEQSPCSDVIQKDPVLHKIVFRKIISGDQIQRMKIEKITAHANGIDRKRFVGRRYLRASHSAVARIEQTGAVFHLGLGQTDGICLQIHHKPYLKGLYRLLGSTRAVCKKGADLGALKFTCPAGSKILICHTGCDPSAHCADHS